MRASLQALKLQTNLTRIRSLLCLGLEPRRCHIQGNQVSIVLVSNSCVVSKELNYYSVRPVNKQVPVTN